jgi:hypothetical protein
LFYWTHYPNDGVVGFMTIRANSLESEKDVDKSAIFPIFTRTWRTTL